MAANGSFHRAKTAKDDEFYTQLTDIEKELRHYKDQFRGGVVLCNCDDPVESNFWQFFSLNFEAYGLKKLIATHFETGQPTYKLELSLDSNGDGRVDGLDVVRTPLAQNGDFRSPECVALLDEADFVITNPPFSLFREYVTQLVEHGKKFLIIGNQNAVTYKEISGLLQEEKVWLGYRDGDMAFRVPDHYEPRETRYWQDESGQKWRSLGNACWFTNLDTSKRHEDMVLYKAYNPTEYPTYVNYDAIEVGKFAHIPSDYEGSMGVPITFLGRHNPAQFEIVGFSGQLSKPMAQVVPGQKGSGRFYLDNGDGSYRRLYDRVVIRRTLRP
jgi:Adenine-specific methyltransferase EcoRI